MKGSKKKKKIIHEEIIIEPVFKTSELEIVYPDDVYQKIMHWVRKTNLEVSGFGACKVEGSKIIVVDAFILDEGSSAETTISAEAVAKMDSKMMQMYPEYPMKLWWHSHPTFGVFWSGTDRQAMSQLSQHGWFAFTVFNQKGEFNSAVAIDAPFRILLDQVKTTFPRYIEEEKVKGWDADFQLMKDAKPKPQPYQGWLRQGSNDLSGRSEASRGAAYFQGFNWNNLNSWELAEEISDFKRYGYTDEEIKTAMGEGPYHRGIHFNQRNSNLTESTQRTGWIDDAYGAEYYGG